MSLRIPAAAVSIGLSAVALLVSPKAAGAQEVTPFGATAIATRIDMEYDAWSGTDIPIYQGQTDPEPTVTIPATSATAAAVGPRTLSTAHASLSTGILRASARATGGLSLVQAYATARIWETLSFENTSDLGLIQPFTVTVDGNIVTPEAPYAKALLGCIAGTTAQTIALQAGTNTYDFFFVVPAGQTTQYFQLDLSLTAYVDSNLDFSHTVTIAFPEVEGITFSSASGTFLSAVPEPGAASLVVMAVATFAARRRRRA